MMQNKATLLILIAILAVIRFVLIPVFENQGQQQIQLQMVSTQLGRAKLLLENEKALSDELQRARDVNEQVSEQMPRSQSVSAARLSIQQNVQTLIVSQGASVQVFDWTSQRPLAEDRMVELQARLVLQGTLLQLMNAQMELQQALPFIAIRDFELQQGTGSVRTPPYRLTLTLQARSLLVEASGGRP